MYQEFTIRNLGYIAQDLQAHIGATTILIAGCGLGSVSAEVAVRTGFKKFILVDGDTVGVSNLNRQIFNFADVGKFKAQALKERIIAINPEAEVEIYTTWLNASNAAEIVGKVDIVFETIDFLDINAIGSVHEAAAALFKPVISSFSCAWGTFSVAFMPGCMTFKEFIGLSDSISADINIVDIYRNMIGHFSDRLPVEFLETTENLFKKMKNGIMCPASQLSVGVNCTAAVMVTLAVRILSNQSIKVAPEVTIINLVEAVLPVDSMAQLMESVG